MWAVYTYLPKPNAQGLNGPAAAINKFIDLVLLLFEAGPAAVLATLSAEAYRNLPGPVALTVVTSKSLAELLSEGIYSIVGIFLYFLDIYSDVQVVLLLFATDYVTLGLASFFFLLAQYVVVYMRSLSFIEASFPNTAYPQLFKVFGYLMLPFFDVLMFVEPLKENTVVREKVPGPLLRFLCAYRSTRTTVEVIGESAPQLILQCGIFIFVMRGHEAGIYEFAALLPTSILLSAANITKSYVDILVEARVRELTLWDRLMQQWRMGGALPANASLAEMKEAGYTALELKAVDYSLGELKAAGFNASALKTAGFDMSALKTAGFDASALKTAGFNASALKTAGFNASALKTAGFDASALKTAGFDASALKTAGFDVSALKTAGFDASALKTAGFDASALKTAGVDVAYIAKAYSSSELGIDAFMRKVGSSLDQVKAASSLDWNGKALVNDDCEVIVYLAAIGALPQLKELTLYENQIGDVGMQALAGAVSKGALPQLKKLYLHNNQIGDVGTQALAGALSKGALPQLETLSLSSNKIGDSGLSAFATVLTPGPSGKGALAPGANVYLMDNNSATETGKQAMRNAAKARGLSVHF